jgi:hypothetical protein
MLQVEIHLRLKNMTVLDYLQDKGKFFPGSCTNTVFFFSAGTHTEIPRVPWDITPKKADFPPQ